MKKAGGRLYLTTPNRVHRLAEGQKPCYKFHVREFSAGEIPALLSPFFSRCEVSFVTAPQEYFKMEKKVARLATLVQRLTRWDCATACLSGSSSSSSALFPGRPKRTSSSRSPRTSAL